VVQALEDQVGKQVIPLSPERIPVDSRALSKWQTNVSTLLDA
jgi:hypothetical protein